ncbi:MAG TPA: DUF5996 family protein [Pseudonocardiaceae bacterium]|nr:DUF5996 family protein [Pseudonocardiaceae bacterium]
MAGDCTTSSSTSAPTGCSSRSSDGQERAVALAPKPVAEFYAEMMAALRGLDLEVPGWTMPSR